MTDISKLRGSFTPVITPFTSTGQIDFAKYRELLQFQIAQGSHGIVVNGTTAEPSVLSVAERNDLVTCAVETVAGRIPVIAATGSQSLDETLDLTRHSDETGVDAVMVVTPYYIKPPQRGLIEYYTQIGQITSKPLLIYHIPGRAGVGMDISTVAAIKTQVPHMVGMKHASADLGYVTELFEALGHDFLVFVGLEEYSFPMLAIGAVGLMNAVGNMRPDLVAAMCNHASNGEWEKAKSLHFKLFELNKAVFWDTNPIPMKYIMKRIGLLDENIHRLPMSPATSELETRLDDLIDRCGLFAKS